MNQTVNVYPSQKYFLGHLLNIYETKFSQLIFPIGRNLIFLNKVEVRWLCFKATHLLQSSTLPRHDPYPYPATQGLSNCKQWGLTLLVPWTMALQVPRKDSLCASLLIAITSQPSHFYSWIRRWCCLHQTNVNSFRVFDI